MNDHEMDINNGYCRACHLCEEDMYDIPAFEICYRTPLLALAVWWVIYARWRWSLRRRWQHMTMPSLDLFFRFP